MKIFIKLVILRSSTILSSKHRINPYLEKIDEIKSDNKLLKPEVRLGLQSANTT